MAGSLLLPLADGSRWAIQATDERAAGIVGCLGEVMGLQQTTDRPAPTITRRLLVAVEDGPRPFAETLPGCLAAIRRGEPSAVCALEPYTGEMADMLPIHLQRLSLILAYGAQGNGGLLIHGALAEGPPAPPSNMRGDGVILAGPGTVGKTTASRRLPAPWRALCDDTTLVARDAQGRYWAHPWPTWSRFLFGGKGGRWDVGHAVPLQAIFLLHQATEDRAEPVEAKHGVAPLVAAVEQVSRLMTRDLESEQARHVHFQWLDNSAALARAVPIYRLHNSLTGTFWEEIERVLHGNQRGNQGPGAVCPPAGTSAVPPDPSRSADGTFFAAYVGPSMNPTLSEPELMEVAPYDGRSVRAGDVIMFQPPHQAQAIAHRVARVTPSAIVTRGDNNPCDDEFLLQAGDVAGQVIAAWRGQRRRAIPGRWRGRLIARFLRGRRALDRIVSRLLRRPYHALASLGIVRRLWPARWRPRVVAFESRNRRRFQLVMGNRVVGRCDRSTRDRWQIRRPFRLLVDEAALPRPEVGAGRAAGRKASPR